MTPREIVEAVAELTLPEVREFRILLRQRLGMDLDPEDDDGAAGAPVLNGPKGPLLHGMLQRPVEV